jgi:hypothetical protein
MTVSEEDVTGLVTTLNGLDLPAGQRELLNAIIKVVADIQERLEDKAFTGEFNDAFTKKHADLVMEYVTLPPDTESIKGIFEGASAIIRNPQAVPPGIIKGIIKNPPGAIIRTPPPDDDDDNDEQP